MYLRSYVNIPFNFLGSCEYYNNDYFLDFVNNKMQKI